MKVVDKFESRFAEHSTSEQNLLDWSSCVRLKDERPAHSWSALTLRPKASPVFFSYVEAPEESLSGQIAVKMSRDSMRERALQLAATDKLTGDEKVYLGPTVEDITQAAFREANQQVYKYGHRMQAGGNIAARGFAGTFDGKRLSLGRVGNYESFLWRDGDLQSFYVDAGDTQDEESEGVLDRFIGANAKILVDIASVTLKDGDILVLTTARKKEALSDVVRNVLSEKLLLQEAASWLAREISSLDTYLKEEETCVVKENIQVMLLEVGCPPIVLDKPSIVLDQIVTE